MTQAKAAAPRRPLRQRYPWLLPGGLLVLLTFLTVSVVAGGPLLPVNRWIRKGVHHAASSASWKWLREGSFSPARLVVDLGTPQLAFTVLAAVAAVAAARRRTLRPLFTAATGIVLVVAIVIVAKFLLGWLHPGYAQVVRHETLGTFPSGHTTTASVCYILAVLIAAPDPGRRGRRIALGAAAAIGFLVGLGTMWTGMHTAVAVLAGWTVAPLIVLLTTRLAGERAGPGRARQQRPAERHALASTDPGPG